MHIYKLENLAAESVQSELDSGAGSRDRGLPNGADLSKKPISTSETGGVRDAHSSSNSRDTAENRVALAQDGLHVAAHDTEETSRFEKLNSHSSSASVRAEKTVDKSSSKVDPSPSSKKSSSSVTMDSSSLYDRLGMGLLTGVRGTTGVVNGAPDSNDDRERYDTLDNVEKALAELEEKEERSRREKGVESRDTVSKDEGRSYFIGGRGRREGEPESSGSLAAQARRDTTRVETDTARTERSTVRGERDAASPEEDQLSLKGRLKSLSDELQGHIQVIADREKSSLQSLGLEIHMGEVKVRTHGRGQGTYTWERSRYMHVHACKSVLIIRCPEVCGSYCAGPS